MTSRLSRLANNDRVDCRCPSIGTNLRSHIRPVTHLGRLHNSPPHLQFSVFRSPQLLEESKDRNFNKRPPDQRQSLSIIGGRLKPPLPYLQPCQTTAYRLDSSKFWGFCNFALTLPHVEFRRGGQGGLKLHRQIRGWLLEETSNPL
jgi:hypothetical protein